MGAIITFVFISMAVVACGSDEPDDDDDDDDDNQEITTDDLWSGSLGAAKYESDAALFEITTEDTDLSSIELTASGNYIVMFANNNYMNMPARKDLRVRNNPFARKKATRESDDYSNGLFGEFKKLSENKYDLDGFGIVELLSGNKIRISGSDDFNATYDVIKKSNIPSNELNDRFCRTWYVKKVTFEQYVNGKLEERYVISDIKELQEEYVKYAVMTKAGTFIQVDWDNEFDSDGVWKWHDEKNQIYSYKFYEDDDWGYEQVAFKNSEANFIYKETESYQGQKIEVREIVTCTAN